jgi:VWFA-related protein
VTRQALALVIIVGLGAFLDAQDERVEVRLVEIEARVTDREGRPVEGLQRDEFILQEDSVPHEVSTLQFVPTQILVPESEAGRSSESAAVIDVAPASTTWLYVATEVGPTQFVAAYESLRRFVSESLPRGFKVSIGGLPFTEDRQSLLSTVDAMRRGPYGNQRGIPPLIDTARAQHQDLEAERALAAEFRAQEEGVVPLQGFVAHPEQIERSGAQARPFITESRLDRQLPLFGDVALYRYLDLIEQLAPLPGKKVVVLFRPGLRVESDNAGLMQQVASLAVRRRVSFYTVDSRGLDPLVSVEGRPVPMPYDRRRRQAPDNVFAREMQSLSEEGLVGLARETGGKSVTGSNGLDEIFHAALRDSRGYYVLGYYPIDLSANGRYRRIRVDVKRHDVKLEATRGYYEPRTGNPFGGTDKTLKLRRALLSTLPRELGVATTLGVFAGGDGSPVLVLSTGAPALALADPKRRDAIEATALVRIADASGTRLPIYFERKLTAPLDDDLRRRVAGDRSLFLSMSDMMPVAPGPYQWRVVFRDDRSGKLGGAEGTIDVPDFTAPSTPSTLLVTREVVAVKDPASVRREPGKSDLGPLEAGGLRFIPQPSRVFRQGDTIHLLYHLYNATDADFEAAARGTPMGLLRRGVLVSGLDGFGEPFLDREHRTIRFAASFRTKSLDPGEYLVFVVLPNHEARSVQHLVAPFVLVSGSDVEAGL